MATIKKSLKKKKVRQAKKILEDLQAKSEDLTNNQETKMTANDDGSMTVEFADAPDPNEIEGGLSSYKPVGHYANLVDMLEDHEKMDLAHKSLNNVGSDENARADWLRTINFGFDLLGIKLEEKNTPFEGACSAQHPLLMESAVKFQSKASNELLPANGPVKTQVMGDVTIEKEDQANRVKAHMNYQILEEMTEFYTDHERLLLYTPLVGSGFTKTYYNSLLKRPCCEFVPADQFIVPNSAPDLFRADRYTHILYKTDYEFEQDCADGLYTEPEGGLGVPAQPKLTDVQKKTHQLMGIEIGIGERDKVYTLYEHHVMLFLPQCDDSPNPDFDLASPYIVTVDYGSQKLVGLRRNWKEGDKDRKKKVAFTHFNFVPSFNFYGYGFLHLLGNLQLSLTAALRALVDAGQFATLQGGFKLKGVRILDDGQPIHPGQFKELETAVMDINKAIMPLPFKEPSNVLYQMLNFLDAKGQKFADSTEQVIADSSNYGPVGTTMALLDASTKFFSAIHKRLHASLKNELKIIADINSETLEDDTEYNIENQTMAISRNDYGPAVAVIPVSDPNISSSAHRMAKAQALYEFSMRAPELHDMREVLKHVYTNMDYVNIDKILPKPEEAQQNDPLTDIQFAVGGKPIKAFPGQDHKAHIAIKQAFLQDPMSGQNPLMQKAAITIQSNVQEHMMLGFMEQVQAQAQMSQQQQGQEQQAPDPNAILTQAAQQVAQMNQQNLQNQLEQQKQSPRDQAALMLAHAELMDTQTQAKKVKADVHLKAADLGLKSKALDIQKIKEANRANEFQKKHNQKLQEITTTKGLDAMIAGLTQGYQLKTQKDVIEHTAKHAPKPPKNKST